MRIFGFQRTVRHRGAIHRAAERHIQSSGTGADRLHRHRQQTRRPPRQKLLLKQCHCGQQRQADSKPALLGSSESACHGSRGRSGLGITLMLAGFTTFVGTPLRS